ncbi:MAG: ferrous iron transport protein A [Campylobacterales bacterium]|nr:ferrous iron transport protein A [Campylobacterales bacterium]
MKLHQSLRDTNYKIKRIETSDKKLYLKFLDMGFVEGAVVERIRSAPLKDPVELRIHGYLISVRVSEAKLIEVEEI